MEIDSKQQANLAVNVLRKLLYREHGWTEPSDLLVYDDNFMQNRIQEKEKTLERIHKIYVRYTKDHNIKIPVKDTEKNPIKSKRH